MSELNKQNVAASFSGLPLHGWNRMIVGGLDIVMTDGQPLPSININTLIDPLNQRMLALGPYDQTYVDDMRNRIVKFFKETYDLDFLEGFHDPTLDAYFLPNAVLYQVTRQANLNDKLPYDSAHPERIGKWSAYQVGALVMMTKNGTYSGGMRNGVEYQMGDLLSMNEYNFIDPKNDWQHNPHFRETIYGFPIWPARQASNSFGVKDTTGIIQLKDSQQNIGYLVDATSRSKLLDGNWTLISRAIFTF